MLRNSRTLFAGAALIASLNFASGARAEDAALELPAGDILSAARMIEPQTGPFYSVQGQLHCSIIGQEVPPFKDRAACDVVVNGQSSQIADPNAVLEALQAALPRTGPVYRVEADFAAQSLSSEVPPFTVSESASATNLQNSK